MADTCLSDLFHITERFRRSVHLERDFYTENALEGYIVTVKARETLNRLILARENEATSKAWSLTGPYGSGKSAFALFAAKLFGNPEAPPTAQALALLKHGDASLYERFIHANSNGTLSSFGFCPVLISGERGPITFALLRGLEHGLEAFGISSATALRRKIKNLLKTATNGTPPQASEITALFEDATRTIAKNGGKGLLLVIDELGKFLEYAAQSPAHGDVFVLQTLAEFATRSTQTPLFLLTILHQAFEQYAHRLAKSQREEWAKVQGRFEDIAFVEPSEQILRLIASAIQTKAVDENEILSVPIELDLKPNQLNEDDFDDFSELLQNCLPLHPTVALVVGSIFRRFAQNERSLFAFLSSSEPYGLQDFLSKHHYDRSGLPMLSMADLYDYLNTTIGSRLYASRDGNKWGEIEMAISRLTDPSPTLVKLIKTIGLLGIIGEVSTNLKASKRVLRYALDDHTAEFNQEFDAALTTLDKRTIVTYRRYNDIYKLWEGSDIDIEALSQEAERNHLDPNETLTNYLSKLTPPRPLIARRHLFEKGTLRYFEVRYANLENFDANLNEPLSDADGLVLYALPEGEDEVGQFVEKAKGKDTTERQNVLIGIPHSTRFLRDAVTELASLHWISENTPELEGDAVARRELSIRWVAAERDVADQLAKILGSDSDEPCKWFHKGQEIDIHSQRARNEYLSEICDTVYHKTPLIRNELINRRKPSATVTTARRRLIQAMLENGDQEDLGIVGYPAEMSIYRSLLWQTGIHRKVASTWGFYPPDKEDRWVKNTIPARNMVPTWKAIEEFLETCEAERQPVVRLYKRLIAPPYGVRQGPLPILLCAALLHYKTEIALYENGSFIPDWSMPVFERLLKAPQSFELKRFQMTGDRSNLFSQFLEIFNPSTEIQTPDLLTVITPLIRTINQLPKYTLTTQELRDNAKNLRKVLQNAREPDELLFKQVPEALGFQALGTEATDSRPVPDFFNALKDTLRELAGAYEELLNFVEKCLAETFNLQSRTMEKRRAELVGRTEPLLGLVIETELRGFLIHIHSGGHDSNSWLEAIATFLVQKPPKSWGDIDKAEFEMNLSQLARKFRHFETVSYEKVVHTHLATGEPIRVGITTPSGTEQERVVTLTPTADKHSTAMEDEIKKIFDQFDVDDNPELHIAILARISQKWIQQLDQDNGS